MADEIKVVIFAGALGWIGGFFKSTTAAKGSNK